MSVIRLGRFLFRSFCNILPDVKGKNCNFSLKFCTPNCTMSSFSEFDMTNAYIIYIYLLFSLASGRVPGKPLLSSRSECRDAKSIATEICARRSSQTGNTRRIYSRQFWNGFTARVGCFPNGPAAHFRSKFILIADSWGFS